MCIYFLTKIVRIDRGLTYSGDQNDFLYDKARGKRETGYNRVKLFERSIRCSDCRQERDQRIMVGVWYMEKLMLNEVE